MRTRAQKREHMPELTQQLQRRLRALETSSASISPSAPLSPPAPKKRKTDGISASPLLLTPHHVKPRVSMLNVLKTPGKPVETKPNVIKRVALCRTLQYSTPGIPKLTEDPRTVLQRICSGQMLCSNSPIVGRVEEHQIVRNVLNGEAEQGSSLYIIGPPGTGKSSSVNQLLVEQGYRTMDDGAVLKRKRAAKSIKTAVKINCGTFTDPADLYAAVMQLVKKATNWKVSEKLDPFEMDNFLSTQRRASKTKKHSIAVVLDEVDQLLRLPFRMQPTVKEILHFFLRWAAVAPSVKFLGIMNGVDMFEQLFETGESAADFHVARVVFGSYTHQDLLLILQSYVQSAASSSAEMADVSKFIESRAVELIARKVAARDGDARLAISLLQQSARQALQGSGNPEKISMRDVFQSVASMLSSPVVQQIKQLPRQAKLLLYVITALAPSSNESSGNSSPKGSLQQCDMNQVSEELARLRSQPQTAWVPRLSREELQTHLMSLDCYALVRHGGNKRGEKNSRPAAAMSVRTFWTMKLSSCVLLSEVSRAIQDDTSLTQLLL
ncbi:Origin recognition complex subunit 1 [Phytophthora citrophthora]|uniref:Origin recognition complex subunit 1 n=1 Tax=Phytophthora citrophthora TaxID=4793 RepID=A0AAD9GAU6_9STRA|nr:Origin recognition complex subunit 1 [Phytophthora citrophthora]